MQINGHAGPRFGSNFCLFLDVDGTLALVSGRAVAEQIPGVMLEDQGLSLALHYRGAPHAELGVRRAVVQLAERLGESCVVQEGHMVMELRPRGATKGDAVRAFLEDLVELRTFIE